MIKPDKNLASDMTGLTVLRGDRFAVLSAMKSAGAVRPTDLYRIDLGTGRTVNLTGTPRLSEDWPHQIDRTRLLFTGGLLPEQTGGPTGWVGIFDLKKQSSVRLTGEHFLMDSATIAFGGNTAYFDTTYHNDTGIWSLDLKGGEPQNILPQRDVVWPAVSPDGQSLLVKRVGTPGHHGPYFLLGLERSP
jgi:hypothetical protein